MMQGKNVLITGADKGVGKCLACCFAREKANLFLVSSPQGKDSLGSVENECKSEGASSCECYSCDLGQQDQLTDFIKQVENKSIDVLINNAGTFVPAEEEGPLKGDAARWHDMLHVNLTAPMFLTRAVAPKMVDKGAGCIINIGDVEGLHTGPHHPAYAATKHGLRGWSLACYEALRDKNIKVVLVSPGNVAGTEMQEQTGKGEQQGKILPEDVAEACLFAFRLSENCVPSEIVLKAVQPVST